MKDLFLVSSHKPLLTNVLFKQDVELLQIEGTMLYFFGIVIACKTQGFKNITNISVAKVLTAGRTPQKTT